jgi:hypothetical protein
VKAQVRTSLTARTAGKLDEAHDHKNLDTRSNNSELDIDGSGRASDLEMKLDYLRTTHGRRVRRARADLRSGEPGLHRILSRLMDMTALSVHPERQVRKMPIADKFGQDSASCVAT